MSIAPLAAKVVTNAGKSITPIASNSHLLASQASDTFTPIAKAAQKSNNAPIGMLGPMDIHIRPDSLFAEKLVTQLQDNSVAVINQFSPTLKNLDEVGAFHWYAFGRKIVEKMMKVDQHFVKNHDIVVVVNRKSAYTPERNKMKAFVLENPDIHKKNRLIKPKAFQKIPLQDLTPVLDDATMKTINSGEFYYTIAAVPKGTFSNGSALGHAASSGKVPAGGSASNDS